MSINYKHILVKQVPQKSSLNIFIFIKAAPSKNDERSGLSEWTENSSDEESSTAEPPKEEIKTAKVMKRKGFDEVLKFKILKNNCGKVYLNLLKCHYSNCK